MNSREPMDPEVSRLIDSAADIAISGRWVAVAKRIDHLAETSEKNNMWWVRLFACLCHQVSSEYSLLKRAHQKEKKNSAALIAWRARNLLELSVWCFYCMKSRENAHRLYEDAGRDVFGIFDAFTKWGVATAQDPNWIDPFTGARQDLSQRAAAEGIDSLDGQYKKVGDAAEECGLGDSYRFSYRMLSKFAHPTAMQILAIPDEAQTALQKDVFFSQGCLFFTEAFRAIEWAVDMGLQSRREGRPKSYFDLVWEYKRRKSSASRFSSSFSDRPSVCLARRVTQKSQGQSGRDVQLIFIVAISPVYKYLPFRVCRT